MADTVLHDPQIPEEVLVRARADAVRAALPATPPEDGLTVILRLDQITASSPARTSAK